MIAEINIIRDKIDELDKKLLLLLAKRLSLVSELGEIKTRYGIPIYVPDREFNILNARRKDAIALGVPPELIEDILRRLMRESYLLEYDKGFKKLNTQLRNIVIIGGLGKMGKFFGKMLTLSGYHVQILEKEDWIRSEILLKNAGMVIISVPINKTVEIINKLPTLPDDCILVDLTSIKNLPMQAMLNVHKGPVLGLHPMFCPDIKTLSKQVVIYCEGRHSAKYQWLLEQIKIWGAILYRISAIEHDYYMSYIQVLRYFSTFVYGLHITDEKVDIEKLLKLSSPIYRVELSMVGRFFSQNPYLYFDIMTNSDFNFIKIKNYLNKMIKVIRLLENLEIKELICLFEKIKISFESHSSNFLKESRYLLLQSNDFTNKNNI